MLALVLGMSVHAATGHDPLVGPTSSDDGLHHVPTAGRFFFSSPTRSSPSRFVSSPPLRLVPLLPDSFLSWVSLGPFGVSGQPSPSAVGHSTCGDGGGCHVAGWRWVS